MKYLIIITTSILMFMSCKQGWDEDTKNLFIQSCTEALNGQFKENQITGYCNCALEEVMKAHPNQEEAIANGPALHQSKEVTQCKETFLFNEMK